MLIDRWGILSYEHVCRARLHFCKVENLWSKPRMVKIVIYPNHFCLVMSFVDISYIYTWFDHTLDNIMPMIALDSCLGWDKINYHSSAKKRMRNNPLLGTSSRIKYFQSIIQKQTATMAEQSVLFKVIRDGQTTGEDVSSELRTHGDSVPLSLPHCQHMWSSVQWQALELFYHHQSTKTIERFKQR